MCAHVQALKPSTPSKDPVLRIASLVQSVILLREALTALPSLADALEPAKSELLKAVSSPPCICTPPHLPVHASNL